MSNSTLSERVLQKLADIDKELESVFETASAIKDLEIKIKQLHEETDSTYESQVSGMESLYNNTEQNNQKLTEYYESVLSSCEKALNALKNEFLVELENLDQQKSKLESSILQLENRKYALEESVSLALNACDEKQKDINAALSLLSGTKHNLSDLENKLTHAFSGLDKDISNKVSEYLLALDSSLTPTINKHLTKSEDNIATFQENLEIKVDELIDTQKSWLKTQQEDSIALSAQIDSSINNLTLEGNRLTQQVYVELNSLQEKLSTKVNRKIVDLHDIKAKVTAFVNNSMNDVASQLKQKINTQLGQLEQRQMQFLEHQRALVDEIIQRQNLIENNTPEFKDAIAKVQEFNVLKDQEIKSLIERIESLESEPKTKSWFRK